MFDYSIEFAWFGYFNVVGVIAMVTAFCMLPFTLYLREDCMDMNAVKVSKNRDESYDEWRVINIDVLPFMSKSI